MGTDEYRKIAVKLFHNYSHIVEPLQLQTYLHTPDSEVSYTEIFYQDGEEERAIREIIGWVQDADISGIDINDDDVLVSYVEWGICNSYDIFSIPVQAWNINF